jgi:prepilin peptidase CpaA
MSGGSEIALWALLVVASVTDLLWGKIFNAVTFFFLFAGILYRLWRVGLPDGGAATLAVAVAFLLFFPLYRVRVVAAGDVKLLMAAGAWSDSKFVLELAMGAVLMGAVVGAIVLVRKLGILASVRNVRAHARITSTGLESHRMPFAPAFLCAFFVLKIAEMCRWSW